MVQCKQRLRAFFSANNLWSIRATGFLAHIDEVILAAADFLGRFEYPGTTQTQLHMNRYLADKILEGNPGLQKYCVAGRFSVEGLADACDGMVTSAICRSWKSEVESARKRSVLAIAEARHLETQVKKEGDANPEHNLPDYETVQQDKDYGYVGYMICKGWGAATTQSVLLPDRRFPMTSEQYNSTQYDSPASRRHDSFAPQQHDSRASQQYVLLAPTQRASTVFKPHDSPAFEQHDLTVVCSLHLFSKLEAKDHFASVVHAFTTTSGTFDIMSVLAYHRIAPPIDALQPFILLVNGGAVSVAQDSVLRQHLKAACTNRKALVIFVEDRPDGSQASREELVRQFMSSAL